MKADTDELELIREIDAEICKLDKKIRSMLSEEAAFFIVKQFFDCKEITGEMRDAFHEWLLDGENSDAKDKAMWRMFEEYYVGSSEPSDAAKKGLEEMQIRLNFPQKQQC